MFNFINKKPASPSDWLILASKDGNTVLIGVAPTRQKAKNRLRRRKRMPGYSNFSIWEARLVQANL